MQRQRGFNLIELLVALVIGLFLMLGLTTLLANTLQSNSSVLKVTRLNQELRATMMLITRDLRRAGYWGSTNTSSNPFQTLTTSTSGCILYSYDRNDTGAATVPASAQYGFLLLSSGSSYASAGVVLMRSSGTANTCTPGPNNLWQAVTDGNVSLITTLAFTPNTASSTVTVSLAGQLVSDSSVKQTLTETVALTNGPFTYN